MSPLVMQRDESYGRNNKKRKREKEIVPVGVLFQSVWGDFGDDRPPLSKSYTVTLGVYDTLKYGFDSSKGNCRSDSFVQLSLSN